MKTAEGEPLVTGLHVSSATSQIYSTFVSMKGDATDLDMFMVDGCFLTIKTTGIYSGRCRKSLRRIV